MRGQAEMKKLRAELVGTMAGLALVAGLSFQAKADPEFVINPNQAGVTVPGVTTFTANEINGVSSALITELTGLGGVGSTQSEQGYLEFSQFFDSNTNNFPATGLGQSGFNFWGLYGVFQATSTTTIGTVGSANNENTLTSLTANFYYDPANGDTYTSASTTANTATSATVTDVGSNDVLLATATLIQGVSGFDASGGPFLNATLAFAICSGSGTALLGSTTVADPGCTSSIGTSFFAAPVPFFDLAFEESNTTITNVSTESGFPIAVSSAAIKTDTVGVNFETVPEPASLALIGSGIFGLGLLRRRAKRA
jgi:hypothetical protein